MRYLVHSEDATFNSATGRYEFNLVTRIPNPVRIRINQATYTAATASTYPQIVYLRSEKLSELTRTKHTVELKNNGHEDITDVLCALQESHDVGRYNLKSNNPRRVTFPIFSHIPIRKLDFYFTNNRTLMAHSASSSSGGSGVTDADISAITDLLLWFPMTETTLLSSAYANTPNIGDNARYIYPGPGADSTMVFNGYQDFQVSALGLGRGISSQASWQYAIDSSMPNYWQNELFTVVFSMKMPSSLAATHKVFDFYSVRVEIQSPGVLYLGDGFGSSFTSTNLAFIPTKDYLITIVRKYNNSTSVHEFGSQAENLETNVIVVGNDTPKGRDVTTPSHNWNVSDASQHFLAKTGVLGPLIGFPGNDATFTANAQSWIRAKYDGGETSGGAEEETTSCEDATFFVELDVNARNK